MTHRVATYDLDGTERVHDLPWTALSYTHVLNGPGALELDVSMTKVSRADVEPGQTDYRIYQDETLRAEGRIWNASPNTNAGELTAKITGSGIAGILSRRLIEWDVLYVLSSESDPDPDTFTMTQQDILFDTVDRSQAEDGGDLGITQGTHTGDDHYRHRQYCREDGIFCSEVFEDFAGLSNGLDWALTPTLTDSSRRELLTWNPRRGSALDGSIVLDGETFLDDFSYNIDASQIVTRGRAVGEGDNPAEGDAADAGALATYGLLEDFEQSQSPRLEDADETAEELISPFPLVAADVTYQLTKGPAIGDFDCGDYVAIVSPRPGWELTIVARVQEIGISVQLPDDDAHTFVRVNWSEAIAPEPPPPPPAFALIGAQGASTTTSDLCTIDPTGAGETSRGPIGFSLTSLTKDPTTDIVYASTSNNSSAHPHSLVTIDTVTGLGTFVAGFSSGGPMTGLSISDAGVMYGIGGAFPSYLVSINKTTGVETTIGSTDLSGAPTAFDDSGVLWGIRGFHVSTINLSTGAYTDIYTPGFAHVLRTALTFSDGFLWGLERHSQGTAYLFTVDLSDGTLAYKGGLLGTGSLDALLAVLE